MAAEGPSRPAPAPFSPRLAVAWTVLATSGLWLAIALVFLAFPRAAQSIVLLGFVQVLVYALILVSFKSAQARPFGELLALQKASLGVCLAAMALGFLLQIPATLLSDAVERVFPTPAATLAERIARITPHNALQGVAIFLVVAGLGPCVEEFFFRGALYGALRRNYGTAVTAVTVATCFALGHMDLRLLLPLFITALAIGEVREVSRSIWPGLALHCAFNAATLSVVFAGAAPSGKPPQMPLSLAILGCVGSAVLLYGLRASARTRGATGSARP